MRLRYVSSRYVSDVLSLSLGPPEDNFARLEPARSQKPEAHTSLINPLKKFRVLYVHKYPPDRPPRANFALPEPARSPKSQKKAGSSPPEARKLEAHTSLIN